MNPEIEEPRIGSEKCDVMGCDAISTCIVGCGEGHPSCDLHARGEDYVFPPRPAPAKSHLSKLEWIETNDLLSRRQKRDLKRDLKEHGERAATRGRFPRNVIVQ